MPTHSSAHPRMCLYPRHTDAWLCGLSPGDALDHHYGMILPQKRALSLSHVLGVTGGARSCVSVRLCVIPDKNLSRALSRSLSTLSQQLSLSLSLSLALHWGDLSTPS